MQEFRFLNCIACKATKLTNYVDYNDVLDESPSKKKLRRNFVDGDVPVSNTSFRSYLKFFLLFKLLNFEGTQPALAGSDFSSGLQSISFLGDLSNISTGFASVRKISL